MRTSCAAPQPSLTAGYLAFTLVDHFPAGNGKWHSYVTESAAPLGVANAPALGGTGLSSPVAACGCSCCHCQSTQYASGYSSSSFGAQSVNAQPLVFVAASPAPAPALPSFNSSAQAGAVYSAPAHAAAVYPAPAHAAAVYPAAQASSVYPAGVYMTEGSATQSAGVPARAQPRSFLVDTKESNAEVKMMVRRPLTANVNVKYSVQLDSNDGLRQGETLESVVVANPEVVGDKCDEIVNIVRQTLTGAQSSSL